MPSDMLTIEQVRDFIRSREVELVLASPPDDAELFLQASFDGEGHFFGISFAEVDYVCIPGGVEVTGIRLGQFDELASGLEELRALLGRYSGPALVVEADGEDRPYLIVADRIEFSKGPDWPKGEGKLTYPGGIDLPGRRPR